MQIKLFNSITLSPPKNKIYSRLGYARGVTKVDDKQRDKFENYIDQALALIELKGMAARIPIIKIESPKIALKENITFESKSLAQFLSDCQEVLFIAATAGSEVVKAISEGSLGKDVTAAVVFDAVASEMTDSALTWIMNYFNRELARENKQLTLRRFSAGYGDFALENQKIIYDVLDLGQLGISLSDNYILIPEKTVTAAAGVRLKEEGKSEHEQDK